MKGFIRGPSSTIWFGLSIHAARENVLIYLRHSTLPQIIMGLKKVRKTAETHSTRVIR